MKLTRIGTIQNTESGIDYYRLSELFNTDEWTAPALLNTDEWTAPALRNCEMMGAAKEQIEDWLRVEHGLVNKHCSCTHDCCGHRFYSTPDLLPDFIRDEFIVSHSWGINV